MLTRRNTINTDPRQTGSSILWLTVGAIFCSGMSHATAAAQSLSGQAQVRSMTGVVTFYNSVQGRLIPFTLRPGDILQQGNVIETGSSGPLVIALDDGSLVIIHPGSRVVLKNFSSAGSWRDLLEVTFGRVRATINHHGKRPNPYRVYSPIASIAVRGTDFSVSVEPSTETRVVVYEGLVEVSSLVNPQQTVLVKPGHNVVVRPGGDIGLVSSGPGSQLNGGSNVNGFAYDLKQYSSDFASNRLNDQVTFFPLRFTAFSDSHFDSLQNPAFASDFTGPEAR